MASRQSSRHSPFLRSLTLCFALLWGTSDPTQGLIHSTGCSTTEQHPNLNCHSEGYFIIHRTQIKAHDLSNAYFVWTQLGVLLVLSEAASGWSIDLPARGDALACIHIALGNQNGASEKHEVFVTVGLNKCREERWLPADRCFLLSPVAKVVWIVCMVVGQIHAEFQSDWLTLT